MVTTWHYCLPQATDVMLTVYDVLGREVITLVNERKAAGVHPVRFDAAGLPDGLYVYQLQAGSVRSTKTFVVLR